MEAACKMPLEMKAKIMDLKYDLYKILRDAEMEFMDDLFESELKILSILEQEPQIIALNYRKSE